MKSSYSITYCAFVCVCVCVVDFPPPRSHIKKLKLDDLLKRREPVAESLLTMSFPF